jgi:hypothetical protein
MANEGVENAVFTAEGQWGLEDEGHSEMQTNEMICDPVHDRTGVNRPGLEVLTGEGRMLR